MNNFPLINSRSARSVVVSALLLALVSCFESDSEKVVSAVKEYNAAVTEAYRTLEVEPVEGHMTGEELKSVSRVLHDLMGKDETMRNELVSFLPGAVKIMEDEDMATVDTKEVWKSWRQDRATGVMTRKVETIEYELRYSLVKEKRRWLVSEVKRIK